MAPALYPNYDFPWILTAETKPPFEKFSIYRPLFLILIQYRQAVLVDFKIKAREIGNKKSIPHDKDGMIAEDRPAHIEMKGGK